MPKLAKLSTMLELGVLSQKVNDGTWVVMQVDTHLYLRLRGWLLHWHVVKSLVKEQRLAGTVALCSSAPTLHSQNNTTG